MPSLINRGLIVVGGPKNVGKSLFAATIVPPAEMSTIVCHDGENSMDEIRAKANEHVIDGQMVDFGVYLDLASRFGAESDEVLNRIAKGKFPWKTETERGAMESYFLRTAEAIQDLDKGKHSIYIHEPASRLEAGIYAFAVANSGISVRAKGGEFWVEAMYPVYEALFDILRGKGINVIILTAHTKESTIRKGNKFVVVPNKLELAVKPRLYASSSLMLMLLQDVRNIDGAPAGLVLKERMPALGIDPETGNWKPRRMLPRRIPHCTWFNSDAERGSIDWYMKRGADLEHPHETEVWSDFEQEVFGEFLNRTQMRMMVADAERELVTQDIQGMAGVFDLATQKRRNEIEERLDGGMSLDEAIADIVSGNPPPVARQLEAELRAAAEGMEV